MAGYRPASSQAWKKGVKSLYYCRSKSIQRAEVVATKAANGRHAAVPHLGKVNGGEQPGTGASTTDYEECLACQ